MKREIKIEGNVEDPKVQKGMLANLFDDIKKDLVYDHMKKLQIEQAINIHDELKEYLMNLYDEVCSEDEAPFTKTFFEKTFDIWWEDGIEKAIATEY